jgi:hypothetical protein
MKKWGRGFWKELFSRDNSVVSTPVFVSLIICAPIVAFSLAALVYDVFMLGFGLTEPSVKLLSALIVAGAGGLAASQFSKRTYTEMLGRPAGEGECKSPAKPASQGDHNADNSGG